ncbi:stalk domain-containing protein [Paenibacillus sp. NPDC056722]|uniref:stalk domain-containing protein n=1 Tax=Paenibacillus sp. NPDC056722 TaxID=3345924 RepID=UPI0036B548DF
MKLSRSKSLMLSVVLCVALLWVPIPQAVGAAEVPSTAKLSNIKKIVASPGFWGGNAFALGQDGTVWAWGSNVYGQFANGVASPEGWTITPHRLAFLDHTKDLVLGRGYYLALKQDGTVTAWGRFKKKDSATLTGKSVEVLLPQNVSGLTDVVALSSGTDSALAVKKDGTVWEWNSPADSETGYTSLPAAVKVPGLSGVKWVGSERYHAALKDNGTLWVWGTGAQDDNTGLPKAPTPVSGLYNVKSAVFNGDSLVVLTASGAVWSSVGGWNSSNFGIPSYPIKFQKMSSLSGITSIDTNGFINLVQNQKGEYWIWGAGSNQKSLQKITSPSNIARLELNLNGFAAVRKDGTVWTWGHMYAADGQLSFTQPRQIKGLQAPVSFATGENSKYAVMKDGTVAAWGTNMFGQLGISALDSRPFTVSPLLKPVTLIIDGQMLEPLQPPIFREGRVLVPLRDVAQSLGYTIGSVGGIMTLTKDGKEVVLQDGNYKLGNGRTIPMGESILVSYTSMVPAAQLAQALGFTAKWEGSSYTLTLQENFLKLIQQ